MKEVRYMISDAAKKINVEPHVLRYWEEELGTEIPRNEMGHRYYREEDIRMMQGVKYLKEKGFQLKSIKILLPEVDKTMQLPQRRLLELRDRLEIAVSREELRLQREEELKKIPGSEKVGGMGSDGAAKALEDGTAKRAAGMPDVMDIQEEGDGVAKNGEKEARRFASGTQADRLISNMAGTNECEMEKNGGLTVEDKSTAGKKEPESGGKADECENQGNGAFTKQNQDFGDIATNVEEPPKKQWKQLEKDKFVSSMAVPWKSEKQERCVVTRKNEVQEREAEATSVPVLDHAERMRQFRRIMNEIIMDVMRENNRELTENITASVSKELEYHMRKREMQQEEHFKQLDRTLREYQMGQKQAAVAKECSSRRESKFFKKNGKVRI